MKKLLFSFVLLSVWSGVSAEQISVSQAASIAEKYLGEAVNVGQNLAPAKMKGLQMSAESPEYYVFNTYGKKGFVIISGDDELTELVGYSNEGEFRSENAPENLRAWLDGYAAFVRSVRDGESRPMRASVNNATPVVEPLVTTRWNQGEPYNLLCPYDSSVGVTCPTGCAATSMAQLINYHEWPVQGKGTKSYNSSYGRLTVDFSKSVYDWANMKDRYESYYDEDKNIVNEWTDTEANAVAKLMYDCGVALEMGYGPYSSGAADTEMPLALCNYFNYHADLITRDGHTVDEFLARIKEELDNSRPLVFNGQGSGGGHSYIVDGYDSNDYLHVNWGWGGISDGYFNVSYMNPDDLGTGGGSGGFNEMQSIVVAYPDETGEGSVGQNVMRLVDSSMWGGGDGYVKALQESIVKGEDFKVEYYGIWNMVNLDYIGEFALGIFDSDGKMLSVTASNKAIIGRFNLTYYPETLVANEELAALSDGDYTIRMISRQQGYDDWVRVATDGIDIAVSGNEIKKREPVVPTAVISCENLEVLTSTVGIDDTIDIQITLKNDSEYDFMGKVSLLVSNDETNKKMYKSSVNVFVGRNGEQTATANLRISSSMKAGRYRIEVDGVEATNDVELNYIGGEAIAYVEVVDPSGVASVGGDNVSVSVRGNVIYVDGTADNVAVYDLSGVCVCSTAEREIPMNAPGVYFVKVSGQVWKVLVR